MKLYTALIITVSTTMLLHSCVKEYSDTGGKRNENDTLPANYPFATGYCDGIHLGVDVLDTSYYRPNLSQVLPTSAMLDMPVPGDQGGQPSCAAWATIYSAATQYKHRTTGEPYSDTGNLSAKFTYNQITKGDCRCTSIIDHLYLLKTQGAPSLAVMPSNAGECSLQPDSVQRARAAPYKIKDWQKLDMHNLKIIKKAIAEKMAVVFAISVDDGFKHMRPPFVWKNREGDIGEPHALVICGYDDSKKAFRLINSWSKRWADGGFAWIDYDFFLKNVFEGGYILL